MSHQMTEQELIESILIVFREMVKKAGLLKENEYRVLYGKEEDRIRFYLQDLINRTQRIENL